MEEKGMEFAKKMANEIGAIDELLKKISANRLNSTSTIQNYMTNPLQNITSIQQQMELMIVNNGVLREIIQYKCNLPTYDHYLVVEDVGKYKTKEKMEQGYLKAVTELERYNIKPLCRWIMKEIYSVGEIYIFKEDDNTDINYFKLPPSMCKVTYMRGMLQGYSIKIGDITDKTLPSFPTFIQKLYQKKKNGKLKTDKNFVDNYYKIDLQYGCAFTIDLYQTKGIPYYAGLLADLGRINDLQNLNMVNAEADNFKLVHQLLPTDSKTGDILVDYDVAYQYHNAVKGEMPDGVACVTTPYKIDSVTLANNSAKNTDYIANLKKDVYDSSGVDSSLFNSEAKTNTQAIVYSGIIDSLETFNLLDRIKLWLNFDFKTNDSKLKNFKISFCDSTAYNKDAKHQSAVNNSATYNSRFEMLALSGKSPLEAYNLLKMEELMNVDEMIVPLANAHTQSSDGTNGRPTASESSGDINKVPENGDNGDKAKGGV